ncbi:hypothetical protein ACWGS9_19925 [Bradyrhizobium sp. Arg314]
MTVMARKRQALGSGIDQKTGAAVAIAVGTVRIRERAKPASNKAFGAEAFGRKRVIEINMLIEHRHPRGIPEHDDDDDGYLFPVAHALHCGRRNDGEFVTKLTCWIRERMPWAAGRAQRIVDALKVKLHPRADHMTAAGVAGYLRTTEAEKRDLKLSTIGIYGMTAVAYDVWLADEKRRRDRERKARKRLGAPSRSEWLSANRKNREKQWKELGISRAEWYRRLKKARETGCSVHDETTDETGCSAHGETGCSTPIVIRLAAEQPVSNVPIEPSVDDLAPGGGAERPSAERVPQTDPKTIDGSGAETTGRSRAGLTHTQGDLFTPDTEK